MLGDFLKLMGKRVPEASNASSPHVHITSDVQIMELESECSPDIFISRLEACFEHFQIQWQESLQGSELSRFGFGDHPDYSWTLKHADAASCGWIHTYPEDATRVPDDGDHSRIRIAPGLGFMEDESVADPSNFDETEQEARMYEAGEYVPLFVQARKILDYTFTTHMVDQMNEAPRAHLASFKRRMQGVWSVPLLRTVLLLAAMVNCRIPLSAAAWVNKLFVPIYIHHSEDLLSVGLLAKHARQPKHQRQDPLYLLCVGQHLPSAEMVVEKQHNFMGPASNVSSNPFHKPRPIDSEAAEKLEAQKADYEARIADMSKVYQANFENTIKDYEAKLSEKEKLQEIEIEHVRDFINHDVVEIKKKSETKLHDLAENYEAKIAHLENESKSKLEKTIKHYEVLVRQEEKHGDWLLKEVREGYETTIAEMKKEHALESEAAKKDHEFNLGRLNQDHAIPERAFQEKTWSLAALQKTATKEADFLSKSAQPDAEATCADVLADKKADTNDKKPEIDALKGTIDALKDTVGIQMVAAEDLRETVKDLRERNAKLEAELQKK
ncbi:uncharacterized protein J4E87_010465 [Alternaria ethzedia]|uniref:uncharacterized protein n=1 Tax=Alternaria ethzedia TaxID=181014 RepID=UPI0020C4BAEA|nr:uncharacterized protein J4E87_010465 [Alternaria ethzedia]KAI4611615.1 hypothetical protein J4E87_010465 [Alternaria ethzedia]